MKLYATTTSERASKGQGGNKFIKIELGIEDGKRIILGEFNLTHDDIAYYLDWKPKDDKQSQELIRYYKTQSKGKQKKDECNQQAKHDRHMKDQENSERQLETDDTKGKQKKDELKLDREHDAFMSGMQ